MAQIVKRYDNKQKIADLRKHHSFLQEGMEFRPKMFYYHTSDITGKREEVLSFFSNELKNNEDIYTERVDREYNSEDSERKLYKWSYNSRWSDEYELITKEGKNPYYLIPASELEIISSEEDFDLDNPNEDLPFDQITIRDFYAVIWNKPISKKKFLNNLIKRNKNE